MKIFFTINRRHSRLCDDAVSVPHSILLFIDRHTLLNCGGVRWQDCRRRVRCEVERRHECVDDREGVHLIRNVEARRLILVVEVITGDLPSR